MNRLRQKCVIASAGFHLLLLVILLVGPAFLAPKTKVDNSPILDIVPSKLIDAAFSGGGNPHGTPPPPAPLEPPRPAATPPAPRPEPTRAREPEPAPRPVERNDRRDPSALEPVHPKKRHLPNVSTKAIVRREDTHRTSESSAAAAAAEREQRRIAERNERIARAIGASAVALRDDIAPGTTLEALGPGGGGAVYASYDQVVRSIYWQSWIAPQDAASDHAIVYATVTIASDGTVLSARITKPSGDASVDRSIQDTLERVTYIRPFPEGAKDKQRTYTLKFDLKAKRLSG
jgi:TonB family protein